MCVYVGGGGRYVAWLLIAAVYHLPSIRSMGVDVRMNLSLFFTLFLASALALFIFHVVFLGLWYIGLAAQDANRLPELLTVIQNCTVSYLTLTFNSLPRFRVGLSTLGLDPRNLGSKLLLIFIFKFLREAAHIRKHRSGNGVW